MTVSFTSALITDAKEKKVKCTKEQSVIPKPKTALEQLLLLINVVRAITLSMQKEEILVIREGESS